MAGAFGSSMGFGGDGFGAPDPNADAFGAAAFGLPSFGASADPGFGAGSFGGGCGSGDAFAGGSAEGFAGNFDGAFAGNFDGANFGAMKEPEKKSKKDKKSKKNATISDEVQYSYDPYSQRTHQRNDEFHRREGPGDYSFNDRAASGYVSGYGDHVHIKDRYHGVRSYDPWKDIPERPELEPYYTERLQETLGSDYLPHYRNAPSRGRASEMYGGPVLLAGGAADSKAIPTGPTPAGPFLRTIAPAFYDERKSAQGGFGSTALGSASRVEPLTDFAWWPLPRRAAAARSSASALGVKLDNFAPDKELWHSVTELTEAYKRATPEALPHSKQTLALESGATAVRRQSSYSPRQYGNVVMSSASEAQSRTPLQRPRSSTPPRRWPLQQTRSASPSSGTQPWRGRSSSPMQRLQSSKVFNDTPNIGSTSFTGRGIAASVVDDTFGVQTSSTSIPAFQVSSSYLAARPLGSSSAFGFGVHERVRGGFLPEQSFSRRTYGGDMSQRPLLSSSSLSSSVTSGIPGRPVSVY